MKKYICLDCGGDGKETCHNPDHGFISALSFHDIGRVGCPCCGHDPDHKIKNGGECDTCDGKGHTTYDAACYFLGPDGDEPEEFVTTGEN